MSSDCWRFYRCLQSIVPQIRGSPQSWLTHGNNKFTTKNIYTHIHTFLLLMYSRHTTLDCFILTKETGDESYPFQSFTHQRKFLLINSRFKDLTLKDYCGKIFKGQVKIFNFFRNLLD